MSPILSPSQVATFGTTQYGGTTEGCQRKWAFKYLSKKPDPAGPAAAAGKKLHTYLEQYLTKGDIPFGDDQESVTARAMIKHLQAIAPYPQKRVEEPFTFEFEGLKWRGIKDLVFRDGNTLVLHDHKSTSKLEWAKTKEDLLSDVQSIIYARHGFEEADEVRLEWLYGTREPKPAILPVLVDITYDQVLAALPPIIAAGKRILELYEEKPDPNTLEPNLLMCKAFNDCPFWNTRDCDLTLIQRGAAIMRHFNLKEKKKMGFRDRNKAAVETATVPDVATVDGKPSMRERLAKASITPEQFVKTSTKEEDAAAKDVVVEAEIVEDTPKRRGRKPGSKNKPKTVIDAEFKEVVEPNTEASAEAQEISARVAANVDAKPLPSDVKVIRFIVLVNAYQTKGAVPVITLSEYLKPVLEQVQAANEVANYKLIPYNSGGVLAAALYTHLEKSPPAGFLFVDANTDEGRDSLPTLERFADAVIRKV